MFDIFYINNKPDLPARKVNSENEARELSRTRYLWIVDGANNYSSFDFSWEPVPWESHQKHVFKSQHQDNSGTCLIPVNGYEETNYREDLVKRENILEPFIFLDFGNTEAENSFKTVSKVSNNVTRTRFISSYHGTLSRIIKKVDSEYVWVVSSICSYDGFDFTWHPSEWTDKMLHVFASNNQKFGDTFYIHVPTFKEQIDKIELLEWYETIHFIKTPYVCRWGIETVEVDDNSIVDTIKNHEFKNPVYYFTNKPWIGQVTPTVNMWREKTRAVVPLSLGGNTTLVTRDAKNHIKTQVYDYPYIDKTHYEHLEDPLDIVFISNGESNAEENWNHLKTITKDVPNRLVRVDGVKGRVNAYREAAKSSNTAWFFACFAKLKVNEDFDWNWQPDRLQQNKHYIFHAKNPITGLEYGHMAMIAYHKNLVLCNTAPGLDFTLDQEHEVVPILSGTAYYADSVEVAWRSAFREVLKLKDSDTIDNEYRLDRWLSEGDGEIGIWSKRGAEDAVEYYESVNGEFEKLKLSYDWEWLDNYFKKKYDEVHVQ
jgi:hypothetical protein